MGAHWHLYPAGMVSSAVNPSVPVPVPFHLSPISHPASLPIYAPCPCSYPSPHLVSCVPIPVPFPILNPTPPVPSCASHPTHSPSHAPCPISHSHSCPCPCPYPTCQSSLLPACHVPTLFPIVFTALFASFLSISFISVQPSN
jgi:hypothetical protein